MIRSPDNVQLPDEKMKERMDWTTWRMLTKSPQSWTSLGKRDRHPLCFV